MATKAKSDQTISKANRFERGGQSGGTPKSSTSSMIVSQEVALLIQEVSTARERIAKLEAQLANEQSGRRADIERLHTQLQELTERATRAEVQLKLWEDGRIKPKE